MDWQLLTESIGIGGLGLGAIYAIYKTVELFTHQWSNSTEAVNKNTGAFTQLSEVLERSNQREMEFQAEALRILKENNTLSKDTNEKVRDLHNRSTS